jgi:hypothetical protein
VISRLGIIQMTAVAQAFTGNTGGRVKFVFGLFEAFSQMAFHTTWPELFNVSGHDVSDGMFVASAAVVGGNLVDHADQMFLFTRVLMLTHGSPPS